MPCGLLVSVWPDNLFAKVLVTKSCNAIQKASWQNQFSLAFSVLDNIFTSQWYYVRALLFFHSCKALQRQTDK